MRSIVQFLSLAVLLCASVQEARAQLLDNSGLVFQGKIVNPDKTVSTDPAVYFYIEIIGRSSFRSDGTAGADRCVLYRESQNGALREGQFSITIGQGTPSFPVGSNNKLEDLFLNPSVDLNLGQTVMAIPAWECASTLTSYQPDKNRSERYLRVVAFVKGQQIDFEEMAIRSVPFAHEAKKVDGYSAANILKIGPTKDKNFKIMTGAQANFLIDFYEPSSTSVNFSSVTDIDFANANASKLKITMPATPSDNDAPNVKFVNDQISSAIGAIPAETDPVFKTFIETLQSPRRVLAAPTSSGAPSFRSLMIDDIRNAGNTNAFFDFTKCSNPGLLIFNSVNDRMECDERAVLMGGNSPTSSLSLGTKNNQGLSFITNDQTRISVAADGNVTFSNNVNFAPSSTVSVQGSLRIPSGAASGHILTSDGSGTVSWTAPSTIETKEVDTLKSVVDRGSTAEKPIIVSNVPASLALEVSGNEIRSVGAAADKDLRLQANCDGCGVLIGDNIGAPNSLTVHGDVNARKIAASSDVEVGSHLVMKGADSYVRSDADNKYVVLSGGSGWAPTGAAMVLRGKDFSYNPHGVEIYTGNAESMKIDMFGNVTIGNGAVLPLTPKLFVNGEVSVAGEIKSTGQITANAMIETKSGGIKFPDGTIQTTAAFGSGGSGGGIPDVILQHVMPTGASAGTIPLNAWTDRALNRMIRNQNGLAFLSNNRFTLPAGTYFIQWIAPGCRGSFAARLFNHTLGIAAGVGSSGVAVPSTGGFGGVPGRMNAHSYGGAAVVTNQSTQFSIQQYERTSAAIDNLGCAANAGTKEIYTQVFISKATSESVVDCAAMGGEPLEYLANGYSQGCRWRNPFAADNATLPFGLSRAGSFTVPAGVSQIKVYAIGGGGGAGGFDNSAWSGSAGSGGGAAIKVYNVLEGETFNFTVGSGGLGWPAYINPYSADHGLPSVFNHPLGTLTGNPGLGGNNGGVLSQPGGTATGGDLNCAGGTGYYCSNNDFNCAPPTSNAPSCETPNDSGTSANGRGGGGASMFGGTGGDPMGCGGGGGSQIRPQSNGSSGCIVILWN